MEKKMWKVLWKRHKIAKPVRLRFVPYAEVFAEVQAYIAVQDAKVEKYWMEKA